MTENYMCWLEIFGRGSSGWIGLQNGSPHEKGWKPRLRGSTVCNRCRNTGQFLCGVERVKRFVYVNLRCIVRNLKRISKISTLLPPWKNFADAHGHKLSHCFLTYCDFIHPCHRLLHSNSPYREFLADVKIFIVFHIGHKSQFYEWANNWLLNST